MNTDLGAARGCINGCLLEIVGASVIGLVVALICGLPEIVAWVAR